MSPFEHQLPTDFAQSALALAADTGASVAQFRIAQHDSRAVSLRDGQVENIGTDSTLALSVRVVLDGAWGFAASTDLTQESANDAARRALAMARLSARVSTDAVVLADEPTHGVQFWSLPVGDDAFKLFHDFIIQLINSA